MGKGCPFENKGRTPRGGGESAQIPAQYEGNRVGRRDGQEVSGYSRVIRKLWLAQYPHVIAWGQSVESVVSDSESSHWLLLAEDLRDVFLWPPRAFGVDRVRGSIPNSIVNGIMQTWCLSADPEKWSREIQNRGVCTCVLVLPVLQ